MIKIGLHVRADQVYREMAPKEGAAKNCDSGIGVSFMYVIGEKRGSQIWIYQK